MKFNITNRISGKVQFTAEIDCSEDAETSIKLGLAVKWGIKNNADLSYADLRYANLRYANLLVLQTEIWTCYIQKQHIRIGCQYHTFDKWMKFSDAEISEMASDALAWWKVWKKNIKAIHATLAK